MFRATKITIERLEAPTDDQCQAVTVKARDPFARADEILAEWAKTAPPRTVADDFDRCTYLVTFEDGRTVRGDYELVSAGAHRSLADVVRMNLVAKRERMMKIAERTTATLLNYRIERVA